MYMWWIVMHPNNSDSLIPSLLLFRNSETKIVPSPVLNLKQWVHSVLPFTEYSVSSWVIFIIRSFKIVLSNVLTYYNMLICHGLSGFKNFLSEEYFTLYAIVYVTYYSFWVKFSSERKFWNVTLIGLYRLKTILNIRSDCKYQPLYLFGLYF